QIESESQIWQHLFIIRLGNSKTSISAKQTFSNLSFQLSDISFNDIHTKVNHRKAYITANRLSKKAIQIGLDARTYAIQKLESFINEFINKYIPKNKEKIIQKRNISQQEYDDETSS
ncbi:30676_t:CDS:1, partial [Racocetra persica]